MVERKVYEYTIELGKPKPLEPRLERLLPRELPPSPEAPPPAIVPPLEKKIAVKEAEEKITTELVSDLLELIKYLLGKYRIKIVIEAEEYA